MTAVAAAARRLRLRAPGLRPRVAALFLVAVLTPLLAGAWALDREIRHRQTARVDARLHVALQASLTELRARAAGAALRARTLASAPALQRALRRHDLATLARLAGAARVALPGGRAVGSLPPGSLRRDVTVVGGGRTLGTVAVAVPLGPSLLARLTAAAPLAPGDGLVLVRDGRIVAGPPALRGARITTAAPALRLARGDYRAASATLVQGSVPTRLVAVAPQAAVDVPAARLRRTLGLALLATLGTLGLLSYALGGPLMRALGDLTRRAESAVLDELTGLANRRALDERLSAELERAARFGSPLALLMLDVDRFKSVNDTHGHRAGDDVLRTVGKVLRAEVRTIDLPARHGGEEFVVLLPGADAAGGHDTAERIRGAVAAREIATAGARLRVTVSVGVAEWSPPLRADELVEAADRALYAAKQAGRDRVAVARD